MSRSCSLQHSHFEFEHIVVFARGSLPRLSAAVCSMPVRARAASNSTVVVSSRIGVVEERLNATIREAFLRESLVNASLQNLTSAVSVQKSLVWRQPISTVCF